MKIPDKKITHEDRFARKYYCNVYRFVKKMKRQNRKLMRRILKSDIKNLENDEGKYI